ncbi:MAG: class I SAM-dependent DNA methyltransferase [Rhodobacteraceae bacterium]|nr:class I SAM-dependent DNA methyltransferase [Paracoccaceae bacterium]
MTPHQFIEKWNAADLKERSASQSHFNDLCTLLGIDDPVTADPTGDWFTFEKGASKTTGGEGWADVWRKGCFAWEYKGPKKDLDRAFAQLQQYAIALENPPLLIVSDMTRFRIHTNWTNTVQRVHEFTIEDLRDAATRDLLRHTFTDPDRLRPAKTRQMLTEQAADRFAGLALRLRARGHHADTVAHFVNRLVFCMFAEDVDLLPGKMFQRMLEHCQRNPADFQGHARTLFGAMKDGGMVGFETVEWFNGGLFDDDSALPLEKPDLADLLEAAKLDWSDIDPSILGTLFERGLDPDKRSQLGAHYTDRDKIMQIVGPVVVNPLLAEWAGVKAQIVAALDKAGRAKTRGTRTKFENTAQSLRNGFLDRLTAFRVLDPACGSGNFLNLALLALKDLEHRVNLESESLGIPREFPRVGPECVKGIELNPYAAELARVSVWVGEIQWMRRNGFDAARNPILRSLGTIECRDAVLTADGTRADWPRADAVVGNPPFLGNKRMIGALGEDYTQALRRAWDDVPGGVDLVTYWFAKAWAQIRAGELTRAGLVATNSIRGGANREVLKPIVDGGRIFEAWADEEWTVEGAAVRVSLVCFDGAKGGLVRLDGAEVGEVYADLTAARGGVDLTGAARTTANKGVAYQGPVKVGPFDVIGEVARQWLGLPSNPNGKPNSEVLFPLLNGTDITRRDSGRWIINFGEMNESDASLFEVPFEYVRCKVKPLRDRNRDRQRRENWWRLGRSGTDLKRATAPLHRAIFTPRVAKHRLFVWAAAEVVPDSAVVVIARDDDTTFGILHSRFHELWALRMGTFLGVGNDPRYTPSTTFETFPFPEGLTPDIPAADYADDPRAQAIAIHAARLNELRENWLNPADLVMRVPEVVPGYPDRILPKDDAAAKELRKRTLTNLYKARPAWLIHAHKALDEAVAEAYGWGDDWRAGLLGDDEILARLFRLNQDRAAAQDAKGKA